MHVVLDPVVGGIVGAARSAQVTADPRRVSALADIGKGQEKGVREALVEQLEDLLRDPWIWTPWSAAYGLKAMKAAEAIDALEAFGKSLSVQEQAEIDRLIASLRREDKTDGSAVRVS